jgi:thiol-disulfide isomerase/thioredoxin
MALFERVHLPSFAGATGWLNSEPLGPAELRGHVVLVNFWTWTCINWLRQEPYVRAWSQAYRDDGLIVIGVHTPEFSFEHEIEGVRRASRERAIDYPVVVDNDRLELGIDECDLFLLFWSSEAKASKWVR